MEYVLDASYIEGFAANKVTLSTDAPALDALPPCRPDAAIERDARAALGAALPNPNARRGVKFFVQEGAFIWADWWRPKKRSPRRAPRSITSPACVE